MKDYRFLGAEGRTTIPYCLRTALGWQTGDLISFEAGNGVVTIRREKVCSNCRGSGELTALLDSLTEKQQFEAMVHLSVRWAQRSEGMQSGE